MLNLDGKLTGQQLSATEWDNHATERQSVVTSAGQTLSASAAVTDQLQKAIATYVGVADWYTASGSNTITLSPIGIIAAPPALKLGLRARFIATANNTGATTINVNSTGAKSVVYENGNAFSGGEFITGYEYEVFYNGTNYSIKQQLLGGITSSGTLPKGYYYGCALSYNSTTAINIDVGAWRSTLNDFDINLNTALGKNTSTWASGGTTGSPTGGAGVVIGNNTYYRVFLIAKPDGTVNAGFDTSSTATNLLVLATGYTKYRQIGWVLTDSSAHFVKFFQYGFRFVWDVSVVSYSGNSSTGATSQTVQCPPSELAIINLSAQNTSSGTTYYLCTSLEQADTTPSSSCFNARCNGIGDGYSLDALELTIKTNTNSSGGQIRRRASTTDSIIIQSVGWIFNPTV